MDITTDVMTDVRFIKAFLKHPDIRKTIAEDGATDFEIDFNREKWVSFSLGTTVIGLYNLEALNHITLEIHAHVLPKFRAKYSNTTGTKILEYVYDELKQYNKVVAYIPKIYSNVYKFTKSFGFKDEGINRQSYQSEGKIYDVWCLGITRSEIGAFLNGQS